MEVVRAISQQRMHERIVEQTPLKDTPPTRDKPAYEPQFDLAESAVGIIISSGLWRRLRHPMNDKSIPRRTLHTSPVPQVFFLLRPFEGFTATVYNQVHQKQIAGEMTLNIVQNPAVQEQVVVQEIP